MCPSTAMNVEVEHDEQITNATKMSPLTADGNDMRKWPEECHGHSLISRLYHVYSCWTFSYMASILLKGSQRAKSDSTVEKIAQHDLYEAPTTMQSPYLTSKFKEHFFVVPSKAHDEKVTSTKWKLLRTLWRLAAPTFIPSGFCQLITVLCQVAIPLLVRELLNTLEETPGAKVIRTGMPCKCICLCGLQ